MSREMGREWTLCLSLKSGIIRETEVAQTFYNRYTVPSPQCMLYYYFLTQWFSTALLTDAISTHPLHSSSQKHVPVSSESLDFWRKVGAEVSRGSMVMHLPSKVHVLLLGAFECWQPQRCCVCHPVRQCFWTAQPSSSDLQQKTVTITTSSFPLGSTCL